MSALITGLVRRYALAHDVVDVPNERSSHRAPTPRGGGVAIVLVSTAALGVLALRGLVRPELLWAVGVGGLAVALVGLADDHRSLPAATRLTVHFAAALWALAWLGGLPALRIGAHLVSFGWVGYLLGALGIVWTVNLFNFMDGIDGIAASEAIFVAVAGALLSAPLAGNVAILAGALAFAAACGGFLLWNWPPARIFLGDVGSGYLGYVIVVLAVAATHDNPAALWVWLILGGAFFADATVTLVRRTLRHERVHEAHRSHAYQWLARRWRNHASVTLAVLSLNLAWLLPCAAWAARFPRYAGGCVIVALAPVAALVAVLGSGRKEK
ncbi:MAG: glycosyltransferase family 4 protein [Steroidobacteraceae bacterium]